MTPSSSSSKITPLSSLRQAVLHASEALIAEPEAHRGSITLERPPRADFGDYSTNAALLLAPIDRGAAARDRRAAW